jgi:hypothetical protein
MQRSGSAAVDQPGRRREWLVTGFPCKCGKVELPYRPALIEWIKLEGHAVRGELSYGMQELEKARVPSRIQRHGKVRAVAKCLLR